MASSRGTSNGVDWRDVATQWLAFEELNQVRLSLRMSAAGVEDAPDILLAMEAHGRDSEVGGQASLVSVSVRASSLNARTMEGALSYVLYQIDFLLAEREWVETGG